MAHYAVINPQTNLVEKVFVGKHETDTNANWEQYYATTTTIVRRTSYNTRGGQHANGGVPFRKNFAGIGYTYDELRDAFIPPQPYPSWLLDENTCLWQPPVPYPNDTNSIWAWNEDLQQWEQTDG